MGIIEVPCIECGKRLRFAEAQARHLGRYAERALAFCSTRCNRAFVAKEATKQRAAVQKRREDL